MNLTSKIALIFIVLIGITSCQKSDSKFPIDTTLKGYIQKGPFNQGALVIIQELTADFEQNGTMYTTQTINELGSFNFESEVETPYIGLIANGYYFNEVTGENTKSTITLSALAPTEDHLQTNINILTTLVSSRIIFLLKHSDITFEEAQSQAQSELLKIFNIVHKPTKSFNKLNIVEQGDENAILLAVSAILQGENSIPDLSENISKFRQDFAVDGHLDDYNIRSNINANAKKLNLYSLRLNIENRYREMGRPINAPLFEKYATKTFDFKVNSNYPLSNTKSVSVYSSISFTVNKPLNEESINNQNIRLTLHNKLVDYDLKYNKATQSIKILPKAKLKSSSAYNIEIKPGLIALDEDHLDQSYNWKFETERDDINDDLLLFYNFNGEAKDNSGNNNHCILNNIEFVNDRFGNEKQAIHFNGNGSYVEVPKVIALHKNSWTYSFWYKLDQLPSKVDDAWFLSYKSGTNEDDVYIYVDNDDNVKSFFNDGGKYSTNYKAKTNEWVHVIMTHDNSFIKYYINGEYKGSTNNSFTTDFNSNYIISSIYSGGSGRIYGSMDEVKLYSKVLTASEVKSLYDAESNN